jgi:predicted double-glycine peptidase
MHDGDRRSSRSFLLAVLGLVLAVAPVPGALAADDGGPRYVRSLLEMREDRVVVQKWDLSCGAAALATLLTYQHGDPVPEQDIARALIQREEYLANPALVRVRQGFSLLDLRRYVDQRGYEGVPLGNMTYQDLLERAPMIVPLSMYGYNHFVVFRGALGNRVLLADPSYGNRTLAIETFREAWIEYPEFGHVGLLVKRRDELPPPNLLAPKPSDFVTLG